MGIYDKFKTSDKLETEGVTLDLGHCRIKLARAGGANVRYNSAMEKISRQHKRAIENDLLSNNRAKEIIVEVYADCIILDWETLVNDDLDNPEYENGIEAEDGSIIPFNKENVKKTLINLPDLFFEIKNTADSIQFFRKSILDETVKN